MRSINPATGEVIAEVSMDSREIVEKKIAASAEAFLSWRETTFSERALPMFRLAKGLREGSEDFARLMSMEMGKPIKQARSEVEKCAWACEYFAENASTFLEPRAIETDAQRSHVAFDPLGTILAIMPWNFPFWQVFRCAAPTLMAGNVMLLKHASNVQGCAADISELFEYAGFPDGVFDHLNIDSDHTEAVLRNEHVRGVALTGSTGAGRAVGKVAGEMLMPCVLELGGSDPFVVLSDCDLEQTIERAVYGRMQNNGQSCIAAKRFIVESAIYDDFVEGFTEAIAALKVGDPLEEENDVGPMAREDLRDELHEQVQATIKAGARCLVGGNLVEGPGYYYEPTLLADVTPEMEAFKEETFGPVAAVTRAEDVEQAIALANDSKYGLGASIWTTAERGEKLARRLEAGAVSVNEVVKSDPRLPFGGIKDSGFGRELSVFGIREFVNVKSVYVK